MVSIQQMRKKFNNLQDWHNYLSFPKRIINGAELHNLRRVCYREIEELRKRPLLVYVAKFDTPVGSQIDIRDIEPFVDLVNSIDEKQKSVDVLIHSPGGEAPAAERIVNILRNKFEEVNFLIPHSAYSAATMLALSGNNIVLHPNAVLGPIDPQVIFSTKYDTRMVPAKSVLNGFEKAKKEIKKGGAETYPAYVPLIEMYSLHLLELCEDLNALSKKLVSSWLEKYMFVGVQKSKQKIEKIVDYFSDYNKHKIHSRPLTTNKLKEFVKDGFKLEVADNTLADLLWEANILLQGFFNIGSFVKLFENSSNVSLGLYAPKLIPQNKTNK